MSFFFFFLLVLFLLLFLLSLSSSSTIHIDCGSHVNTTDTFSTTWISDRYFSSGTTSVVSEPLHFLHQQQKTLRYFQISSGKKNCYSIPALPGRYSLRTFTVYDNYDGKTHSPSFDVSVRGTLVFSWRSPWPESVSRSGAYSDLFFYHDDSEPVIDVCFYSIATDSPVIGLLQLVSVDEKAYSFSYSSSYRDYLLVNYGRFSCGSEEWGEGFTNDTDVMGRSWQSDAEYRLRELEITNGATIKEITAGKEVGGVEKGPNWFPGKLYKTAIMVTGNGGGVLEYELEVDAKMDYLLWFHHAEIDVSVNRAGQRVFDVFVNGENVSRVDVFKEVGGFEAFDWSYVVKNLSSRTLSVRLESVVGAPVICGLENYAIVPVDLRTLPEQVIAMKALKESLRVPDRMGWNGDPCAPTSWDAWEGVTCHSKNDSALVVSQIDLGSQGLKGFITDQIGFLTNLVSLNLSSNTLGGTLPSGLGQQSLVKLDLSNNKFTGYIPDSLTSSSLQLVLLNDNLLEGQVPEELFSIGVHGGAIDLSGNKRLCGGPSLPDCPLFWGKHGLSTGGKVGIGLSCLILFSAVMIGLYYFCIKRRHNDYDFGLPHELMSLAAKRNRYQRQKSLMALEMESQHAKGFIPTYNVS